MQGAKCRWIKNRFFLNTFFLQQNTQFLWVSERRKLGWHAMGTLATYTWFIWSDKKSNQVLKLFPKGSTCSKVLTITNGGQWVSNRNLVTKQGHTHTCISAYTDRPLEERKCLLGAVKPRVPWTLTAATLNWYHLLALMSASWTRSSAVWGTDGGGGREQTTGVRVHAGSQPHVSLLPHQSSVCFSLPNFQRHCDCEECATVCNSLSAQCSTFTAVPCGTLGHVQFLSDTNPKCLIKRITHITAFDGI